MKKVFAFLSTIVLTLACVGVALSPVKAAEEIEPAPGMIVVDPTVGPNDIPLYIANSIKTTFSALYDEKAKPDPNYASRKYAWNETKLSIPQVAADGTLTGKFYTPYFAGSTSSVASAAGQYLYFYDATPGATQAPAIGLYSASLSYARFNYTGQDVATKIDLESGNTSKNTSVTYMMFDGNGKAFRGVSTANFFSSADWDPIQCYAKDDETKIVNAAADHSNCAPNMVQDTNEDGSPKVDGNGQAVMVQDGWKHFSLGPDGKQLRILWQAIDHVPTETEINGNGYMGAGWREDRWDAYVPEFGIVIAYLTADANYNSLTQLEKDKHFETIKNANDAVVTANGAIEGAVAPDKTLTDVVAYNSAVEAYNVLALAAAKTELEKVDFHNGKRTVADQYVMPAGGFLYNFGYIERSLALGNMVAKFNEMYVSAMKYGRAEGYKAEPRTYNFSAGNAKVIASGLSKPLEGRGNVFEVLPGNVTPFGGTPSLITPAKNIDLLPMTRFWQVTNDLTSFSGGTTDVLTVAVKLNGKAVAGVDVTNFATYTIDTTGAAINTNWVVEVTVTNTKTSGTCTLTLTYVLTDTLTPTLTLFKKEFNSQQGDTFNLQRLASAADAYGNNLTHTIQYQIDWNGVQANEASLPAGLFNIRLWVELGGKRVEKTSVLRVSDTQKPVVEYQSVVRVPLNGTFYFTDAIKSAVDNLDGNLFNNANPAFQPFVLNSDPINTSKAGRYPVDFEVFDRSGNKTTGSYEVIVTDVNYDDILDSISDVQDKVDTIWEKLNEAPAQQGCAAPAAPAAVAFVSAVGLLASAAFVVLRRRH
jgi:hypothetical protein